MHTFHLFNHEKNVSNKQKQTNYMSNSFVLGFLGGSAVAEQHVLC